MTDDQERWQKYQEALQRATQQGALTPEQAQMVQTAFSQMQQTGATQHTYSPPQTPDSTSAPQGTQPGKAPPTTRWPGQTPPAKAPPTTVMPQPSGVPSGYLDPLYQSATADLRRWLAQNERYRMQGIFAQLEPVFQAIEQITG